MKEYIEREAALSAVDCGNLHKGIVDALQENIKEIPAPTVDAVPVVRCKDCKHYDGKWCLLLDMVNSDMGDWFCAYGERRTDEQ